MLRERSRTWVEVDIGQIKENCRGAIALAGGSAEAIAVVKSNAYGHGDIAVAHALYECGVRRFAVSNIDEAVRLRRALSDFVISDRSRTEGWHCGKDGRECEILILGYTPPNLLDELCAYDLTQALISNEYADELAAQSEKLRIGHVKTHLAIDTGMRRIGIDAESLELCEELVRKYGRALGIRAIFTHMCCADGESQSDKEFTGLQLKRFSAVCAVLRPMGINEAHCLNSAGILWHTQGLEKSLKSLVRPGIILYGLSPRAGAELPREIKPALTWKARIAMVKSVCRGDSIGYGRAFTAPRDMLVATLPVGYADGYPRALSERGYAMINGSPAPVLGRVCMNQMMVDVSGISGARAGDVAVLIGDGAHADGIASLAGTISYELLSCISRDIPRAYTNV